MFMPAIDAKEKQDVMMADVPNAFIQTELDRSKGQEKTVTKITGVLVDLPVAECLLECGPHAVCNNGKKVLCVEGPQAVCSVLVSALSFHPQFKEDLEGIGFTFNPCDPCVAN